MQAFDLRENSDSCSDCSNDPALLAALTMETLEATKDLWAGAGAPEHGKNFSAFLTPGVQSLSRSLVLPLNVSFFPAISDGNRIGDSVRYTLPFSL